jgi:hypothetical protein
MNKKMAAALVLGAALAVSASANAATVTALGVGVLSANLGGGLADFDTPSSVTTPGNTAPPQGPFVVGSASFSGDGILMTGTTSGLYAEPFHDVTQYLTIKPNGPTETIVFSSAYQELGLYWGSMDTYNSIEFYSGGSLVDTVTGSNAAAAVAALAVGAQTNDLNNRYIIISAIIGGLGFDKVVLLSTQNSFELDDLSWGTTQPSVETPLPAALPLFASGMAGLGFLGFFRKKRKTQAA